MPLECSDSSKSQLDLLKNLEPTSIGMKNIDAALEVWSKYWPTLKTDPKLLEIERVVKERMELRKRCFAVCEPSQVIEETDETITFNVTPKTGPEGFPTTQKQRELLLGFYGNLKALSAELGGQGAYLLNVTDLDVGRGLVSVPKLQNGLSGAVGLKVLKFNLFEYQGEYGDIDFGAHVFHFWSGIEIRNSEKDPLYA